MRMTRAQAADRPPIRRGLSPVAAFATGLLLAALLARPVPAHQTDKDTVTAAATMTLEHNNNNNEPTAAENNAAPPNSSRFGDGEEEQEQEEEEDLVLQLDEAAFEHTVRRPGAGSVLVAFLTPRGCPRCDVVRTQLHRAAAALRGRALLAVVDCDAHPALAPQPARAVDHDDEGENEGRDGDSSSLDRMLTLRLFVDGHVLVDNYRGPRHADAIVRFVERAMRPQAEHYTVLRSAADFDHLLADQPNASVVVGVVARDPAALKALAHAALCTHDVVPGQLVFVAADKPQVVAPHADLAEGEFALIHRQGPAASFGNRVARKYDPSTYDTLDAFLKSSSVPGFAEFSHETAQLFTDLAQPIVLGFFKSSRPDDPNKDILRAVAASKAASGKVAFAWADMDALHIFVQYVGLTNPTIPICAYSFANDKRYVLPASITTLTEKALSDWVDELAAGTLVPRRRSQPIPVAQSDTGPRYLVGDEWTDTVNDPHTDVMIAQVTTWCGHCVVLKPVYAKVADVLREAGITSVVIATMDTSENDAPDPYKAEGVPTIHFFPAGAKEGVEYLGEFSSKQIIEFIKAKATIPFEMDTSTLGPDPVASPRANSPQEIREAEVVVQGYEGRDDYEIRINPDGPKSLGNHLEEKDEL